MNALALDAMAHLNGPSAQPAAKDKIRHAQPGKSHATSST